MITDLTSGESIYYSDRGTTTVWETPRQKKIELTLGHSYPFPTNPIPLRREASQFRIFWGMYWLSPHK